LVVAITVAAILAAIAFPALQGQIRKSRRGDAREAVVRIQNAQEDWRGVNTTYASTVAALGLATTSPKGYYTLVVSGASASGYTATATATGAQAADTSCATISVTVAGGQTTYGSSNACWGLP
jgi:type IV pilus assembly protein PilE